MKQIVQNIRTGRTSVIDVPAPGAAAGSVLIRVAASMVSAGTERSLAEFGSKGLIGKARSRPDLVAQTLSKARRDGVLSAVDAVRSRLDQPLALGYSVAGVVVAAGEGVTAIRAGDRVAAAGAGHAHHAEMVAVPANLVAAIPDEVSFDAASATTLGAIALHGIRLADPKLGESVAVLGLGIVGQLTIQLLRANGCRVVGYDPLASRAALAGDSFADEEQFRETCLSVSSDRGVDAVLITAAGESNATVVLAGDIVRDRGTVIAVGAVSLDLPREPYFRKEIEFRVSRSYGPGRYDPLYEEEGLDYPYAYVRWTENRNMKAFLDLMGQGRVNVEPLITHRIPIAEATRAYELIAGGSDEEFLGVVIQYPAEEGPHRRRLELKGGGRPVREAQPRIGFLGPGAFASSVLLPALEATRAELVGVAAATGLSARAAGDRFGFEFCTTDAAEVIGSAGIDTVFIATRHDLHASQVLACLAAGKHVFVEKPLCLSTSELESIRTAYDARQPGQILSVGFNRRFAPMSLEVRELFADRGEPLMIDYRVSGGHIARTHWTQTSEGGGRLAGEGAHFVDWAVWLTGERPLSVYATAAANGERYNDDNVSVVIRLSGGSVFHLLYVAGGDPAAGKERIEVHGAGRTAVVEDFRRLTISRGGRRRVTRALLRGDKGHRAEIERFISAVRSGEGSPISFEDIVASTQATLAAVASLASGQAVSLPELR